MVFSDDFVSIAPRFIEKSFQWTSRLLIPNNPQNHVITITNNTKKYKEYGHFKKVQKWNQNSGFNKIINYFSEPWKLKCRDKKINFKSTLYT